MQFADSSRVGGEREVCTNRCVIVAICGQFVGKGGGESERERERKRERERERERERGRERQREGDGEEEEEGDGEEEEGARILWALGGNLCLAF